MVEREIRRVRAQLNLVMRRIQDDAIAPLTNILTDIEDQQDIYDMIADRPQRESEDDER